MNQFSVFEALDLSGLVIIVAVGMILGVILIIFAIWKANNKFSCGWDKHSAIILILGIAALISTPLGLGYVSYTTINSEYNAILSVDESREYSAADIYKDFGILMTLGTYRVDLSEMDKKLYSRIKHDRRNPYAFIIEKVSDEADKEAIKK